MFFVESNSKRTQAKEIYMLSQLTLKHFIKQMQLQKYRQLSLNSFFCHFSEYFITTIWCSTSNPHPPQSKSYSRVCRHNLLSRSMVFNTKTHLKQFHGNIMLKRFSKWNNNLLTPHCIINRTRSKWQKANVFHQEVLQTGCHV